MQFEWNPVMMMVMMMMTMKRWRKRVLIKKEYW